jgi:hypothetical protein
LAVLAASLPSSQPPRPQPASDQNPADGSAPAGKQHAQSVDRPNRGEGKAGKHRASGGDNAASRGNGKPGKGKNKSLFPTFGWFLVAGDGHGHDWQP